MQQHLQEEWDRLRATGEHPERLAVRIRRKFDSPDVRLWSSLIGGTAVWLLFFVTGFGLTSLNCRWGWFAPTPDSGLKGIQIIGAALAAALVGFAAYIAYKEWQRGRQQGETEIVETMAARIPMLGFVILLLNLLYLSIILITLGPIMMLPACG